MNREIKFRGKRIDNGKLEYGYLITVNCGVNIRYFIISEDYLCLDFKFQLGLDTSPEVIPETVGQFTGLHDKNNNEIYEGDIVDFRKGEAKLYVCFTKGQWNMCKFKKDPLEDYRLLSHYLEHDGPVKVIGNTIDNPELLKNTK